VLIVDTDPALFGLLEEWLAAQGCTVDEAPAADSLKPGDLVSVHAIPDDPHNSRELARARITGPACYLLRPDGHVGLAGARFEPDAVSRYLSLCHIRATGVWHPGEWIGSKAQRQRVVTQAS
jgi:hypothetical protein